MFRNVRLYIIVRAISREFGYDDDSHSTDDQVIWWSRLREKKSHYILLTWKYRLNAYPKANRILGVMSRTIK